ncbi:unnamed protein product [Eruca vesicaria subsp. sativa]|uniref:Protein kinase domain-containing protein n=1 Tax=Eruca vesicaria subsp. sativa TaxID=29727 RepID=A0ABC8LFC8_ERUVS|nr:unnamed protein product [Eruca vesicaria subsp. sativa]
MEWVRGETIGHGTFSTVSLATPSNIKHSGEFPSLMAVKSSNSYGGAAIAYEKTVLDSLGDCPEIVRCYGEDQTVENGEKLHNLLLEYASRGSLASQLNGEGLPESTVRRHTGSVLRGLRHIHSKGFAHCDIKLGNILLFGDGAVKIADFGLARDLTASKDGVEIRGTPLYMAPESVNDNEYGAAADVWALGCAVVEMFSGETAWSVDEGSHFMSEELPKIPEELSEEGKDFLRKCFVRNPEKRWTAEMLLNHPFVAVDCEGKDGQRDEIFMDVKEDVTTSPRCPFGFPDWESVSSESEAQYQPLDSPVVRFESLVSETVPDWSISEDWITVR